MRSTTVPRTLTGNMRNWVFFNDKGLCWRCGEPVDPGKFDIDHAERPWAIYGETNPAEMRLAHQRCNRQANQERLVS